MSIDQKAFSKAIDAVVAKHGEEADICLSVLKSLIEAYEVAKIKEQPDNCQKAFEAALVEGNFTPEDDYGNYHLDEGNLYWLWGKAWNAPQTDEFTLLGVLADIRQKTGVGDKPMLSELADTLAGLVKRESVGVPATTPSPVPSTHQQRGDGG